MGIVGKKRIILVSFIIVTAILFVAGLWGWSKLSQSRSDKLPVVQLIMERDDNRKMPIQGHRVGADFLYNQEEQKERYYIPSLQGIWQLDEPYAQSTLHLNEGSEYISLYCAHETVGGFFNQPHSIHAVRYDHAVVASEPGESADWSQGDEVVLKKVGDLYRIEKPSTNSVYVVRTVWDSGVLEHAWLILEK